MPIKAQIIAHSVTTGGKEIATLELEYPRFIHGELMTHRVLSRNAASSRAIPVARMLEQVRAAPVVPHHWGKNQPGMQAREEISPDRREKAVGEWHRAAQHAAYFAESLNSLGVHKQIANRLLEPFQWMKTIVTATEWDNFFELRRHPDAEPHFQLLAEAMWRALIESEPVRRDNNPSEVANWHLPYINDYEREAFGRELGERGGLMLARISSARCARVSYLTHDGLQPDLQKDMGLYEQLAGSAPIHASPLEHQAFPSPVPGLTYGNFVGWVQHRKLVEMAKASEALAQLATAP